MMCAASVASVLRNFRRAGTELNRCATSIEVPGARPQSRTCRRRPPFTSTSVPAGSPAVRVWRVKRETLAIEGSASPRKP